MISGVCSICGKSAVHTCTLCGKPVCGLHFQRGACTACLSGKSMEVE